MAEVADIDDSIKRKRFRVLLKKQIAEEYMLLRIKISVNKVTTTMVIRPLDDPTRCAQSWMPDL